MKGREEQNRRPGCGNSVECWGTPTSLAEALGLYKEALDKRFER